MKKLLALLDGKKTYIVAIITGILAALQVLGVEVPPYVYVILGALGLGAVRDAIK